jgi:hypothetical protein
MAKAALAVAQKVTAIGSPSNDGEAAIISPYTAAITAKGTAAFLFHRWSCDGIEEKAKAAKGSAAKKTDNLESYVYRDGDGNLAIPSEYFRMSCINAAKYKQDPRSPRKSAMDLFKAGLVCLEEHCTLGVKDWDFLDRRRVQIQRNGITRVRPAMNAGWEVKLQIQVLLPEYISPNLLNEVIQSAGRLVGVGDFRPTFGRFQVTSFQTDAE